MSKVAYRKPFNVVASDSIDFQWVVVDEDGEPVAYFDELNGLPAAELVADALDGHPEESEGIIAYEIKE